MSNRELCINLIESFTDAQLVNIAAILQAAKAAITEAADDAFCESLYQDYLNDPDHGEFISIEEAAAQLGVSL